jgi:hypothetical protein
VFIESAHRGAAWIEAEGCFITDSPREVSAISARLPALVPVRKGI